jgi:hypothetical protein
MVSVPECEGGDGEQVVALAVDERERVVGWLLGKFADWIISVFDDDLFKPGATWTQLPHRNSVAYLIPQFLGWTNLRAPTGTFTFNGHGGSYKVNVHWQVRT